MCGYGNASPGSQEEIKGDNGSSNSFLLRPSVMPMTVHTLEKEMNLLLSVSKCVREGVDVWGGWTHARKCMSFHSRKVCLSCTELFHAVTWGGGRMKISALSHTRAVRLCVERGLIYSTEQLLWRRRNGRRERTAADKTLSSL